jgi:hypothetical protein
MKLGTGPKLGSKTREGEIWKIHVNDIA